MADDDPEASGDNSAGTAAENRATSPDDLKAALARERRDRQKSETERKRLEAELADMTAKSQTDQERAVAEAKAAGRAEAAAEYNGRLLKAEVRSRAAGKLIKPEHATALLDLSAFAPNEAGEFDVEAIDAAVADLLADNPHLGVPAPTAPPAAPVRPPLGIRGSASAQGVGANGATGAPGPSGPAVSEGDAWLRGTVA
jgi:hypothetical protein